MREAARRDDHFSIPQSLCDSDVSPEQRPLVHCMAEASADEHQSGLARGVDRGLVGLHHDGLTGRMQVADMLSSNLGIAVRIPRRAQTTAAHGWLDDVVA